MTRRPPVVPAPVENVPVDDLLDSWKQIANFLHRDVRTTMRWEATRGLPVHRLPGGARRAVYARKSELESWRATTESRATAAQPKRQASIAVLPFANLTDEKDTEYFADGLADEILTLLSAVPDLRVTARTSSFAFRGREADIREIGTQLHVTALLEGSVRRAGTRLRVSVQLIDATNGYHLWAEQFDREVEDVFAIQDEIAEGVVRNLAVRLRTASSELPVTRRQPSAGAFDWYLKGRYFLVRRGPLQRAVECFERALAIDPDFAKAHVGIADAFSLLGIWELIPPATAYARVRASASRALELDESLGSAHAALGSALVLYERDWERGRRHFQRAESLGVEVFGTVGLPFYFILDGRPSEAFAYRQRMLERDPLSAALRTQVASAHIAVRDWEKAGSLLEESLDLEPQAGMTMAWLGFCRAAEGRLPEALPLLAGAADRGLPLSIAHMVSVLVRCGDRDRAQAAHARLEQAASERHVSATCLALSHAALGHDERCLELMARADRDSSPIYTMLLIGAGYLALSPEWLQRWFEVRRQESSFGAAAWALQPSGT